ncbi:MAG: sulfite exporter TauE/SafE family protein [Saprospiraceae bacterium]
MLPDWSLALFFALIAFVYASVGFGGGSSYLALLAVAGLPFQEIRLTALICNIIVVTGGALLFFQNKQLDGRKILPLVAVSVPAAFLGAMMRISQETFFLLLGLSLLVASALLWFQPQRDKDGEISAPKPARDGLLGGGIGLLSGMVGIGGGIFLSPLLHLFRWDTARKIAATASVFILVNSLAGLAGQLTRLPADLHWQRILLLGVAVLLGGQVGSRVSMTWFDPMLIRRLTALLVLVAGIEIMMND